MANLYYFDDGAGETIIPVSDGDFFTDDMDHGYDYGQVYIEFFSDSSAQTPVTPTAGTITARCSPLGNIYLTDPTNTAINAADVQAGDADYTPPVFHGAVKRSKITLSGVTGANYFRAAIWRNR